MPVHRPLITEVIERTAQGMTRPYLCMADDGEAWYVKSAGAHWRSVVCEWVAGRLAAAFGLPLPPIAQPEVDEALAEAQRTLGDSDLAAGPAFGSQRVEHVRDFEPTLLGQCAQAFRRDLVAFDWWVRNADRTLGDMAGNPNLLWVSAESQPVVIDHNLAFDPDFDVPRFVQTHVFRADFQALRDDLVTRAEYEQRFAALLPLVDTIWAEIPHNWIYREDGQPRITRHEVEQVLGRVQGADFWSLG